MRDWKHVYQRIEDHEGTSFHAKHCESYLVFTKSRTTDKLLFNEMNEKGNKEVIHNQQVLESVINVNKLIGKICSSFR